MQHDHDDSEYFFYLLIQPTTAAFVIPFYLGVGWGGGVWGGWGQSASKILATMLLHS